MGNKQFGITVFSITFGITCFLGGLLWLVMAKDLSEKTNILEKEKSRLEQQIIELKWNLSQVDQMICKED